MLDLTQPAPKPEPEVTDRRRFPKPGSEQWLERYRKTLADLKALRETCPTSDPNVAEAFALLAFAMGKDVEDHG